MQVQPTQRPSMIMVTATPPARRVVSYGGSTILFVPAPKGPRGYVARHRKRPEGVMGRAMARAERVFRRLTYAVKHPGWARRRSWDFARTCGRAGKYLPAVWPALPPCVKVIAGIAAAVKCLPLDFGADETLFAIAGLLAWKMRPELVKALYREGQAGKAARCRCAPCLAMNWRQRAVAPLVRALRRALRRALAWTEQLAPVRPLGVAR